MGPNVRGSESVGVKPLPARSFEFASVLCVALEVRLLSPRKSKRVPSGNLKSSTLLKRPFSGLGRKIGMLIPVGSCIRRKKLNASEKVHAQPANGRRRVVSCL